MRILVVDDEKLIVKGIKFNLENDGYEVDGAYDGREALVLFEKNKYDLVLLDLMLPGLDGFGVCRKVREKSNVPIIMLTARDEEVDKFLGLEMGADDYMTKPFGVRELLAHTIQLTGDVHIVQEERMVNGKALLGLLSLDHEKELTLVTDAPEDEWLRFMRDVSPLLT